MSQYKIISEFHNKSFLTNIKDSYKPSDSSIDVLSMLDYEVYSHGSDSTYAQYKLNSFKKRLCNQPDCKCIFKSIELKNLTKRFP